jgi:Ran GTPase-activating protein (RanGAP) involved in mRNA processing and transport
MDFTRFHDKTLDLHYTNIDNVVARSLAAALKNNSTITCLILDDNCIREEGARSLAAALKHNSTLTSLHIVRNNIGNFGAHVLLNHNATLMKLDLGFNQIGWEGVRALANSLENNKTLTHLDLSGNKFGDQGASALARALNSNTTLTNLILDYSEIEDDGACALAEALMNNATLKNLHMYCNRFFDKGAFAIATALRKNVSLTTLSIGNIFGPEALRALTESLDKNRTLQNMGDMDYYVRDLLELNRVLAYKFEKWVNESWLKVKLLSKKEIEIHIAMHIVFYADGDELFGDYQWQSTEGQRFAKEHLQILANQEFFYRLHNCQVYNN